MDSTIEDQFAVASSCQTSRAAWLDGLRGYAALLVFLCHFSFVFYSSPRFAYGTILPKGSLVPPNTYIPFGEPAHNGTIVTELRPDQNLHFLQLPMLRLLSDGDSMVVIFFLVSGYSLSIKPLSLTHAGPSSHSGLIKTLSSAVLRRPLRLILPILISTFLVLLGTQLGLYTHASTFASDRNTFHIHFKGWAYEATPPILPTITAQLHSWLFSIYDLLDFQTHFHWTMTPYDIHLWTIPIELRCSLVLYLTHLTLAPLSPRTRLTLLSTSIVLGMTWGDAWETSCFWIGMFLAELDLLDPPQSCSRISASHALNLLCGLYLMSTPMGWAWASPLYVPLTYYPIPGLRAPEQSRFWHVVGATQVMVSASRCGPVREVLSNGVARYLGRVSFALYLVHGPIMRCLGYSTAFELWRLLGREGWRYHASVGLTALVVGPVTFAVAGWFARVVDGNVTRFARWTVGMLVVDGDSQKSGAVKDKGKERVVLPV